MKIMVTCQVCAKVLVTAEGGQYSESDIAMYEAACFCDTVQPDGSTDGQTNIQAILVDG